ncbi:MAG: hypothetical protein IJH13_02350 [Bacilli bacterium]|nr:hypothetical protein [Bacilli bacterium]
MKALRIISIIISVGYILVGFYLFFANDMEAIFIPIIMSTIAGIPLLYLLKDKEKNSTLWRVILAIFDAIGIVVFLFIILSFAMLFRPCTGYDCLGQALFPMTSAFALPMMFVYGYISVDFFKNNDKRRENEEEKEKE